MEWPEALAGFLDRHLKNVSSQELQVLNEYPWNSGSISGLWSHRGAIWKKHEGSYPAPDQVGLPATHAFFDPDFVDVSEVKNQHNEVLRVEQWHHGRRIKPTHRLYQH